MRYYGQSFELDIPAPDGTFDEQGLSAIVSAFHDEHKRAYGFNVPTEPVELVNLRVVAVQPITKPATRTSATRSRNRTPEAKNRRQVFFADLGGWTDTAVYDRYALSAGDTLEGPAIIEEADSLTVAPAGWVANVDGHGNLILTHT